MKLETELHQAKGLGSAKHGLHHWIAQRVTAIALIPLGLWFLSIFIVLLPAPYEEAHRCFSSLWIMALGLSFILFAFYHGYLGMRVILEDYIHHQLTKWGLLFSLQLISIFMALVAAVSILKVFLS